MGVSFTSMAKGLEPGCKALHYISHTQQLMLNHRERIFCLVHQTYTGLLNELGPCAALGKKKRKEK